MVVADPHSQPSDRSSRDQSKIDRSNKINQDAAKKTSRAACVRLLEKRGHQGSKQRGAKRKEREEEARLNGCTNRREKITSEQEQKPDSSVPF
jgi:hypothetical protein